MSDQILREMIASWTPAQRAGIRKDIMANLLQMQAAGYMDKVALLQHKIDLIDEWQ